MRLTVICFKNKAIGAYTTPQFDDHDKEVISKTLARAIAVGEQEKIINYKYLSLYLLGYFDDETGIFDAVVPELLLDCDDLLAARAISEEKKDA